MEQFQALLKESADMTAVIKQLASKINFSNESILGYAIDSLPFFVFIKDTEGNLVDCNKAFVEANGLPKEQLLGKEWMNHSTLSEEKKEKYFRNDLDVIHTGRMKVIDEQLGVNDTRLVTIKAPLIVNGIIKGVIGFSMDITKIIEHAKEQVNGTIH